jgi:hypothetical protein
MGSAGDPRSEETKARRLRLPVSLPTALCFLVLCAVSVAGCVVTQGLVRDKRDRLLENRSVELSALFSTSLGEVRSALTVLASLATQDDSPSFDVASGALVTGSVRAIGQAERRDNQFVVV